MVQVIEQAPGLGQLLGSGLGAGIQTGLQGLLKEHQTQQQQTKSGVSLSKILGKPELADEFGQLPIDMQTIVAKSIFDQQAQREKIQSQRETEKQKSQGLLSSLDKLDELLPFTGKQIPFMKGTTYGGLHRLNVERREEFDKVGFWAADNVYTHFNKGVLSKEKLKVLKEDLSPNSSLSVRENKARINALRIMSNLPANIDSKKLGKIIDTEVKKVSKFSDKKQQKIDFQIGQSFDSLPKTAPEGAIMRKGNQRFIFRQGKWSKV